MNRMIAIDERVSLSNAMEIGPSYDSATDLAAHSSGRMPEDNAVRMTAIALNHGLLISPGRVREIADASSGLWGPSRSQREAFASGW